MQVVGTEMRAEVIFELQNYPITKLPNPYASA